MKDDDLLKSIRTKLDLARRGKASSLTLPVREVEQLVKIASEKPTEIVKEIIIEVDSNKYRGNIDLGKF